MRFGLLTCLLLIAACADSRTPAASNSVQRDALEEPATLGALSGANEAFRAWVATYQSTPLASRSGLLEQGTRLATTRRTAMRELLVTSPEAAIQLAFSPPERDALPGIVRERVERWHDGIGTLHVIDATPEEGMPTTVGVEHFVTFDDADTNYLHAGVYGRRLEQKTQRALRLHGVEIDGVIGLTDSPMRKRFAFELFDLPTEYPSTCPTSKKPVEQALVFHAGDSAVGFCLSEHANDYEYRLTEQETADGVAASAATMGAKTVLFVRVDFSDRAGDPVSAASAQSLIDTATNNFFVAASYNQTSITTTVTPTFRMPQTAATYKPDPGYVTLMTDALAAAKAAGFDSANYTHNFIASAAIFSGWAGRGYIGSKGVWINGDYSLRVAGHELGHNYGVYHANFWNAGASIIGAGTNVEYGNGLDMMGSSGGSASHFNVWFKRLFDWVPSSEVKVVTTSGTYRISALETAITSGYHGLKVPRTGDPLQRDYWVEFRQAFTSNVHSMNGATFNFGFPYSGSAGSQLLDMTPFDGDRNRSALVIGRTFSDSLAGLHFTTVGKGGTTPESLDVVVNIGTFPGNQAPIASISANPTTIANGGSVTFTVTASDPDADTLAYGWDFDDAALGPNTAVTTRTFTGDRVFNVRCSVSDMKGHVTTVGLPITVGTPANFTLAGSVKDGSIGIEGVRISDGSRATFTTSTGAWQLTNVPAGSLTISATKYNYGFTRSFAAPLTVAGSMTNLDFDANVVAGYSVTGKVTGSGVGLAGVVVSDGSRSATTNSSGDFSMGSVPNGRYTLKATKPGWQFVLSGSNPIEVNGGNTTANFYSTGNNINGSMSSAGVATAPVVSDGVRSATCFANGSSQWAYNLSSMPNGTWNLTATSPGVTLKPLGFTNPIVLAGTNRNGFNFQLDTAVSYQISGTITTGGTPLPGVAVSDGTRSSTSDELGRYVITGVPNGTYTLTPTRAGQTFVPVTKSVTVSSAHQTGQDFTTSVVNAPPTIASAPSASINPVLAKNTVLSVLAADDGGEAGLTYTWSLQGGGPAPVFSANGTNAAKTTSVTFTQGGPHTFEVLVTDAGGLSVRSTVVVSVTQVATQMTVTPTMANVVTGTNRQFTGQLKDQFTRNMYPEQPVYSVQAAAGTVATYGLFTASMTPGGPYTLTVTSAGKSATASILVTPMGAPTLVNAAAASPSTVTGTSTALTVLAADDQGESALTYTWSATTAPSPVTFSSNGTNPSKSTIANFAAAGEYELLVTIADADQHVITSAVTVVVEATPTHVKIEPQVSMVQVLQTLQLTATVTDQFDVALVPQPETTFTVSGGGSISTAGLFTASGVVGGPFVVTATVGGTSGTASIMVSELPDTVAPTVSLSEPLAGSRLISTTALTAMTSDNVAVTKVEFFVDAMKVGEATATPFTVMVDFASIADGMHVLTAKASDAAGNSTTSDGVQVVVGVLPTDVSAPVVSITTPVAGETGLEVAVLVAASDDVGVSSVKLELGGTIVREVTQPPWSVTLEVSAGAHTLVAIASDASGKSTRSAAVAFTAKETPLVTPVEAEGVRGGCSCDGTGAGPMMGLVLMAMVLRRRKG